MVLVSIIIPAYNAERTLGACLQACLAQTHAETEVIVVDDGSSDGTASIAKSFSVHYLHQTNRGPSAARNLGARGANGEILAYTDSDCVPEPDWIEQLLKGFKEKTVAVGGTYGIANPSSMLSRIVHAEIVARHERFGDTVDFLGSFNVAYKKIPFLAIGGFDESFRIASAEDNDLAYRLQDYGGELGFNRDAVVAHHHPERLLPYLRTQLRHGIWRMKLYVKHPNRAEGDKYAGRGELAAPPLTMLMSLMPLMFLLALPNGGLLAIIPAILVLYLYGIYWYLTRKTRKRVTAKLTTKEALAFHGMAVLRDFARGIGLLRGVWTFMVFRRENSQ